MEGNRVEVSQQDWEAAQDHKADYFTPWLYYLITFKKHSIKRAEIIHNNKEEWVCESLDSHFRRNFNVHVLGHHAYFHLRTSDVNKVGM